MTQDLSALNLAQLAALCKADWKKPYFGAVPYLSALSQINSIDDRFLAEDAYSIVLYFISNASTWRGEIAKAVKAELKKRAGIKQR